MPAVWKVKDSLLKERGMKIKPVTHPNVIGVGKPPVLVKDLGKEAQKVFKSIKTQEPGKGNKVDTYA